MSTADLTEILNDVNAKVRAVIERLRPERSSCLSISGDDVTSLLAELLRAGECLREISRYAIQIPPELELQRSIYKDHLAELERRLPDFCQRLLAERSRLVEAQPHLDRAAAWAGRNRNTL